MIHFLGITESRFLVAPICIAISLGLPQCFAAGVQRPPPGGERPAWVVDGVPDTVWILAEASTSTVDGARARELLREAEGHARRAVDVHGGDVGRRFAVAVVLGLRANREGGKRQVQAASELQKELDIILGLDPGHARARHLLGRLHAGVRRMNRVTRWVATNLLGGEELKKATWEEAERNLVFAVVHAPEVSDHHLQLANLYRDTDRPNLALEQLEHVLAMPARSPLERAVLQEAREVKRDLDPHSNSQPNAMKRGQV